MTAIIAGTGGLPIEACKNLIRQKKDFFVISLFPEDNLKKLQAIIQDPQKIIIQDFFKAATLLDLLKKNKTTEALLIGKVDKRNLLKKIKFDWLALKIFSTLWRKNDEDIMEKILDMFKENGIKVIKQDKILDSLFVPPGVLTGKLTDYIKLNINLGMKTAKQISLCGIGQTVVTKDGMVIAIEAIEGTDECIRRGIHLGKKNLVICKSAHVTTNPKYDLPTLGLHSLKNIQEGQISAIAWQANQTFIADKDQLIKKAQKLGITLVSIENQK